MNFEHYYIEELIEVRKQSKANKDWKLCDNIRNYLDEKLVFIFDSKEGQEVYYLPSIYFIRKPIELTNRQFLEFRIKQEAQANKNFDAWLFSINQSKKKNHESN